jgi:MSHA biogenesis protein MshP
MKPPATDQRGVALVNAIFLIVALAALGGYMLSISGVQQSTTNQALINARTLIAARAGLDWAIHRAIAPPTAGTGECSPTATFGLTGYGLENIQVTVECTSTLYTAASVYIYQIVSTARNSSSGSLEYAERKLQATLCRTNSPGTNKC